MKSRHSGEVSCNLLRGPDITRSGAGSSPLAAGCASLSYMISEDIVT